MRLWVRLLCYSSLLIMLFGTFSTTPAVAADQRCFSETRQCVSGRFLEYWEQNGGLAVFGFPITPAHDQINRENGQLYLTQWFERNRFELHPENAAPYDVLLGRLGDDRLRLQGEDWQTRSHPNGVQDGCLWFAETAHQVCNQGDGLGFKSYWHQHGVQDPQLDAYGRSLALFGLPLTEAMVETSPTNGQPYIAQWFERARFEWHPDEPDAYKVLLGLLGSEIHAMQDAPTNSSARLLTSSIRGAPVAAGRSLAWIDTRTAGQSIYRYDLDTQTTTMVTDRATTKRSLASDGQTVAWIEEGPQSVNLVQGVSLAGHDVFTIIDDAAKRNILRIALANSTLYYYDATESHRGIFAHDLATNQERLVTVGSADFVVSEGILIWNSEQSQGGAASPQSILHMRMLDGSQGDTIIAQDQGEGRIFSAAGDTVVWNYPGGPITRYSVSSRASQTIPDSAGYYPVASPTAMFWTGAATTTSSGATAWPIVRYMLTDSGQTTIATIETPSLIHLWAVIGESTVAFTQSNQDSTALYLVSASSQ